MFNVIFFCCALRSFFLNETHHSLHTNFAISYIFVTIISNILLFAVLWSLLYGTLRIYFMPIWHHIVSSPNLVAGCCLCCHWTLSIEHMQNHEFVIVLLVWCLTNPIFVFFFSLCIQEPFKKLYFTNLHDECSHFLYLRTLSVISSCVCVCVFFSLIRLASAKSCVSFGRFFFFFLSHTVNRLTNQIFEINAHSFA